MNTVSGGHKMLAPTFVSVGGDAGCTLADLSVTGYGPIIEIIAGVYTGGCPGGDFILRKMKKNGTYEVSYYWIDNGYIARGWYADSDGAEITGGAASVKFDPCDGVWVLGSDEMKLVTTGAVNEKDVLCSTVTGGHIALGNGSPVDLTLDQLSVTNYPPLVEIITGVYTGGCPGGDFILRKMKKNGTYEVSYYWIDNGYIARGWYADSDGAEITGGATSVKISAGEGVWVYGTGYDLVVPGVKIK